MRGINKQNINIKRKIIYLSIRFTQRISRNTKIEESNIFTMWMSIRNLYLILYKYSKRIYNVMDVE